MKNFPISAIYVKKSSFDKWIVEINWPLLEEYFKYYEWKIMIKVGLKNLHHTKLLLFFSQTL